MVYLIIDAGNTRVKVFVFEGDNIVFEEVGDVVSTEKKISNIFLNFAIDQIILSTVGKFDAKTSGLDKKGIPLILLNQSTEVPFVNLYKTPGTLGVDRIALMSAAATKYAKQNVLVIDAGTCITYDFLNAENQYLGGGISPGLEMRYKALHAFTEKLPLLPAETSFQMIGNDTNSSIHSGVGYGFVCEVDGIISSYLQQYSDLTVVLTGGDMFYLSKRLKNGIFANPNFLVEGLHAILKYNINE